ncbi:MAG: TIGR03546 family protein [Treponema sp.]|nr:TIGR03546 family protein [Candidatus Treponema equifaecale]
MLKKFLGLFKALNANTNPGEIAHAFSCGLLLGFMPKDNLLWYLIFVFILFIRINKPMYLIMTLLGSALAVAFDPLFDTIGYQILTVDALKSTYIMLLDIPFVAFTKFNNSVVMGSLISGIVLYVPMYFLGRFFVWAWRKYLTPIMANSKIVKALNSLPVIAKIVSLVGED